MMDWKEGMISGVLREQFSIYWVRESFIVKKGLYRMHDTQGLR